MNLEMNSAVMARPDYNIVCFNIWEVCGSRVSDMDNGFSYRDHVSFSAGQVRDVNVRSQGYLKQYQRISICVAAVLGVSNWQW